MLDYDEVMQDARDARMDAEETRALAEETCMRAGSLILESRWRRENRQSVRKAARNGKGLGLEQTPAGEQ